MNKNVTTLTPFQKDIISQVLHDELSEMAGSNIVDTTEKVKDIVRNLDRSIFMAVGLQNARDNDLWNKVDLLKKKVTLKSLLR